MSYAAQTPPAPPQPVVPTNGFAVTALVTGIVGLALAWIPFVGFLGFILGVIAIVFGGIAVFRAHKNRANSRGMAWAGLILGIASFTISLAVWISTANEIDKQFGTTTPAAPAAVLPAR